MPRAPAPRKGTSATTPVPLHRPADPAVPAASLHCRCGRDGTAAMYDCYNCVVLAAYRRGCRNTEHGWQPPGLAAKLDWDGVVAWLRGEELQK